MHTLGNGKLSIIDYAQLSDERVTLVKAHTRAYVVNVMCRHLFLCLFVFTIVNRFANSNC